ncbi:NUDIX domain protein [Falsiruegeria litorea R37]|uniref:NUDIX domain protein n=1 Tax=Falsiruegeria litorea R37 TaxID=1200284 RepID=A0A1Y5RZF3_9RHOB|nr:NUDIX hydrolase [Falsiruegeria litorea]SLN29212.1 NUDIX domain protein [Falsiruegeria litorea R37]
MTNVLEIAWQEVVRPLFFRPKRVQVAALCLRDGTDGHEVLMITSRGTGRWIVPKGWPIEGLNGPETALQEAWEEAGVKDAHAQKSPIGRYNYDKVLSNGTSEPVETQVYKINVSELSDEYPEASQRQRQWMSAGEAANLVREPQLKAILLSL